MKVRKQNFTNDHETIKVPFLDPEKIVQYIFQAGLDIPERDVIEFWERKKRAGEEWATSSPASDRHIPIAIYGDSARLYASRRGSKYLGIFISFPLWRPKSTRYSRWCIFSLENAKLYGRETLQPILQRLTYKLNLLFEQGVVGPHGQRLRFCVTEIRGDWEWHKQLFALTSSWKGIGRVCFRCNCKARSDNPKELYHCLDDDPSWEEHDLVEFVASEIHHNPTCLLFQKLGGTFWIRFWWFWRRPD